MRQALATVQRPIAVELGGEVLTAPGAGPQERHQAHVLGEYSSDTDKVKATHAAAPGKRQNRIPDPRGPGRLFHTAMVRVGAVSSRVVSGGMAR